MDRARCQSCAAGLPAGATWCPLCYAPVPGAAAGPDDGQLAFAASVPAARSGLDVLSDMMVDSESSYPQPETNSRPMPAFWPCGSCGRSVPIGDPSCPDCGSSFLAQLGDPLELSWELPLVGRLDVRERGKLIAVAGCSAVILAMLLIAVTYLIGAL